jgi:Ca2+-binding EF-hand superfamily protein
MNGITAVAGSQNLNHYRLINRNVNDLISAKNTNDDNALSIDELGVSKDSFDRIDKNGDGQVGRIELNIAAHTRINAAHTRINAVNEMTSNLISEKDTNSDGVLGAEELGVPEDIFDRIDKNGDGQAGRFELNIAARAAINNRSNHILPVEAPSNLDAIA